ncbi:MAG: hypothetical protein ACREH3_05805 [Geminicoccales bacterium]
MHKLIAVFLAVFGALAVTGTAVACPASAFDGDGRQTVMTGTGTTQTPMPGKPGG